MSLPTLNARSTASFHTSQGLKPVAVRFHPCRLGRVELAHHGCSCLGKDGAVFPRPDLRGHAAVGRPPAGNMANRATRRRHRFGGLGSFGLLRCAAVACAAAAVRPVVFAVAAPFESLLSSAPHPINATSPTIMNVAFIASPSGTERPCKGETPRWAIAATGRLLAISTRSTSPSNWCDPGDKAQQRRPARESRARQEPCLCPPSSTEEFPIGDAASANALRSAGQGRPAFCRVQVALLGQSGLRRGKCEWNEWDGGGSGRRRAGRVRCRDRV